MKRKSAESEKPNKSVIAAGGIIWKEEPFRSDILVIHRTRYGNEWCLPKGKVKKRESADKAALREVYEETGCIARIYSFAGIDSYDISGKEKTVFYWHMKQVKQKKLPETDLESDHIVWLPVGHARRLLTHESQKKLLDNIEPGLPDGMSNDGRPSFIFGAMGSIKKNRLKGSIESYRSEIIGRIGKPETNHEPDPNKKNKKDRSAEKKHWLRSAKNLLDTSEYYLNRNNIDVAWKCFHTAQRLEIFALDPEQLRDKARSLQNESEKLSSWRKKATEDLIGKPGADPPDNILPDTVFMAALLRDEHYNNTAYKDNLFRNYLKILSFVLAGIIILITAFFLATITRNYWIIGESQTIIIGVILFGLFGGIMSAILKLPPKNQSSRIPEQIYSIRISLIRILAAVASALFIYVVMHTGYVTRLLTLPNDNEGLSIYFIFVVSFIAGFSERLVLRAVEIVAKEK